jgi:hypothetical protein
MKKLLLLLAVTCIGYAASFAQSQPYNVVFDMTSKDTLVQSAVIRWVTEISKGNPDARLEVVFYGKSLEMITQGKSRYETKIKDLLNKKNVSFKVCAIAMKNNNVEKSQLLPGIQIVPDGIYEIISKQADHWGYIKAAL